MPRIIEDELFNGVQEKLKVNRKTTGRGNAKNEQYLLTTKVFYGHCKDMMHGNSGTLIDKIYLYDDKIIIVFTTQDRKVHIDKELLEKAEAGSNCSALVKLAEPHCSYTNLSVLS